MGRVLGSMTAGGAAGWSMGVRVGVRRRRRPLIGGFISEGLFFSLLLFLWNRQIVYYYM
jgi:hypothetical protein